MQNLCSKRGLNSIKTHKKILIEKTTCMGSFFYGKNSTILKRIYKLFTTFTILGLLCFTVINPISVKVTQSKFCSMAYSASMPNLQDIVKRLFGKNEKNINKQERVSVYLGGYPLGFTFKCDGVLVIAISNDTAENLQEGDIITHINEHKVSSESDISDIINNKINPKDKVMLKMRRNNTERNSTIKPIFDEKTGRYKLGIWIRDDAAGVGTITYIRKDNMRFGALGHPVCDVDTGSMMPVSSGHIYKCNVVGYKKGVKGDAGELKGLFLRNGSIFGSLDKNKKSGVFGCFNNEKIDFVDDTEIEVADRSEIKSGKATIRCTIDGYTPEDYEIEIVKTYFKTNNDTKSMFIRVTDKRLIERTGGIVQGMSGSPIVQNGKLVGAVTHVFVSDPTKGYGIFADLMINE